MEVMTTTIRRFFAGAAISFFTMVGLCLVIHPAILRDYQYGISQFGAIGATQIPFFVGFAMTAAFLGLIALKLRARSKFLSTIILVAVFCLLAIAITSYPINRLTYDLHWCFVIALILNICIVMIQHIRNGSSTKQDYILAFIFALTTIISILPLVHHIPVFRNFVLRETIIFASSFWFMSRAINDSTVRRPVHKQYSPGLEEIALNAARQALELVHAAIDDSKAFGELVDTVRCSRSTEFTDPTVDEAREIVGITYEANYDLPDKFACLERAVAASLTGARLGLAIYTQFGVAVDPVTFHTWSAVGEQLTPIRLEDDIPIEGRFYPVYTL